MTAAGRREPSSKMAAAAGAAQEPAGTTATAWARVCQPPAGSRGPSSGVGPRRPQIPSRWHLAAARLSYQRAPTIARPRAVVRRTSSIGTPLGAATPLERRNPTSPATPTKGKSDARQGSCRAVAKRTRRRPGARTPRRLELAVGARPGSSRRLSPWKAKRLPNPPLCYFEPNWYCG